MWEDYDLVSRLLYGSVVNLPTICLYYRHHSNDNKTFRPIRTHLFMARIGFLKGCEIQPLLMVLAPVPFFGFCLGPSVSFWQGKSQKSFL